MQRDIDPADDLAAITGDHEPAAIELCRFDVDRLGFRRVLTEPGDREIDPTDGFRELDRFLLRRRLHERDHDLRAVALELLHRSFAGRDRIRNGHFERVLGDHAEHADLRLADLRDLGGLGLVAIGDVRLDAGEPLFARALRRIGRAQAHRCDVELLPIDRREQVGLELLLRVQVRGHRILRVEQGPGIDHDHRSGLARVFDKLGRPRDIAERVRGATTRANLAPNLGEREHRFVVVQAEDERCDRVDVALSQALEHGAVLAGLTRRGNDHGQDEAATGQPPKHAAHIAR